MRRTVATVAALACAAGCAGCGAHTADYSTRDVIHAFEISGVPVSQPIRPAPEGDQFDFLLHAASTGDCHNGDAVSITVWRKEQDLSTYLERLGLQAAYDRWITAPTEARARAQRNVLVALGTGTRCATRAQIDVAFATLE